MTEPFDLAARLPLDHDFSGKTLGGRYKLERRIGYGGTASIYAAMDLATRAMVAVKVLHPEHDRDQGVVQRFVQEGQIAAQVRHPRLVPAYDLGWRGGRRYTAFELVEGRSVAKQVAQGPMPWERTVPILLDLLDGLAALHARGVAHRDISPNNCMIETQDGTERGRLLDFGYARMIEEEKGLVLSPPETSTSMMIWGSEGFVAPERFRGRPGDYRADIFSIGALWAMMLVGEALPDPLNADPVSVAGRIPLPAPIRAVLLGALDIRERRHHSAASMAEALRAATGYAAPKPPARRAVWLAPVFGLLAVAAWIAANVGTATCECPAVATAECPRAIADASPTTPAPVATPPVVEPAASVTGSSPLSPDSEPVPSTPITSDKPPADREHPRRVRFDLGAALAACKPHSTTRLVVSYDPKGPLRINDEPPQGEMGRCVEEVLAHHPPRRAVTLRP